MYLVGISVTVGNGGVQVIERHRQPRQERQQLKQQQNQVHHQVQIITAFFEPFLEDYSAGWDEELS